MVRLEACSSTLNVKDIRNITFGDRNCQKSKRKLFIGKILMLNLNLGVKVFR